MPFKHPYALASTLVGVVSTGLIVAPYGSAAFYAFFGFAVAYMLLGVVLVATIVIAYGIQTIQSMPALEADEDGRASPD